MRHIDERPYQSRQFLAFVANFLSVLSSLSPTVWPSKLSGHFVSLPESRNLLASGKNCCKQNNKHHLHGMPYEMCSFSCWRRPQQLNDYRLNFPEWKGLNECESHDRIKSPTTKTHQLVFHLESSYTWLVLFLTIFIVVSLRAVFFYASRHRTQHNWNSKRLNYYTDNERRFRPYIAAGWCKHIVQLARLQRGKLVKWWWLIVTGIGRNHLLGYAMSDV